MLWWGPRPLWPREDTQGGAGRGPDASPGSRAVRRRCAWFMSPAVGVVTVPGQASDWPPSPTAGGSRQRRSDSLAVHEGLKGPLAPLCPLECGAPAGTRHCGLHTPKHPGRPAAPPQCPRGHACLPGAIQGERLSLVTGAPPPAVRARETPLSHPPVQAPGPARGYWGLVPQGPAPVSAGVRVTETMRREKPALCQALGEESHDAGVHEASG